MSYIPKDAIGLTSEQRVNHLTHYKRDRVVHIHVSVESEEYKLINGRWLAQLPF